MTGSSRLYNPSAMAHGVGGSGGHRHGASRRIRLHKGLCNFFHIVEADTLLRPLNRAEGGFCEVVLRPSAFGTQLLYASREKPLAVFFMVRDCRKIRGLLIAY